MMNLILLSIIVSAISAASFSPSYNIVHSTITTSCCLFLQGGGYLDSLGRTNDSVSNNDEGDVQQQPENNKNGSGDVEEQTHTTGISDPYASGVAESYGLVDATKEDGFDEAGDAVGPGIYGGSVQRDPNTGSVLYGTQYQNHNHIPGPLYDGMGYSLMGLAILAGKEKVSQLLKDYPQLVEEVSTGGARPLHICGMSAIGQHCTQTLVDAGANVHAIDSYSYNALHRMASNDLEIGAEVLVNAGVDPNSKSEGADSTPIEIAQRQRAIKFLMTMQRLGHYD